MKLHQILAENNNYNTHAFASQAWNWPKMIQDKIVQPLYYYATENYQNGQPEHLTQSQFSIITLPNLKQIPKNQLSPVNLHTNKPPNIRLFLKLLTNPQAWYDDKIDQVYEGIKLIGKTPQHYGGNDIRPKTPTIAESIQDDNEDLSEFKDDNIYSRIAPYTIYSINTYHNSIAPDDITRQAIHIRTEDHRHIGKIYRKNQHLYYNDGKRIIPGWTTPNTAIISTAALTNQNPQTQKDKENDLLPIINIEQLLIDPIATESDHTIQRQQIDYAEIKNNRSWEWTNIWLPPAITKLFGFNHDQT